MSRPPQHRAVQERPVALFLLALVLFSPWLLRIFGGEGAVMGWPVLYLYLFGAWAAVILLLALHMERAARRDGAEEP